MKKFFSSSDETTSTLGTRGEFLEELRESFTGSFAYDLFDWLAVPGPGSVTFNPPKFAAASNDVDRGQDGTADPVTLYTSNADIPVYLTGEVVTVGGDGGVAPQTDLSGPLVGVDDFRVDARFAGVDGSGYTIAVLDTGIDLDDPFFGPDLNNDGISDRIVYQYDFADGDSNASDVDGHGSNVSSIAASSDGTYTGMAPGAGIAALKVFEDSGSGYFSYIEEALQWVIANAEAYNIVSVNMSLGDTGNYDTPVALYGIADEMAALAAMDVIVVSASGNGFYSLNSVQGVSYPAADPNSLSVGAVYSGNSGGWQYQSGAIAYTTTADQITPFSQRDDELTDIFAPGAPIVGAGAGDALIAVHGTSQAAPHIAGIVALAQQLAEQELGRKLTFDEIQQLLQSSGDAIYDGDDEDDNVNNTGLAYQRVNVLALGEAILAMVPPESERDPTYFQVSALDKSAPEGDSGGTGYSFLITRSGDLSEADSVDYSVAGSGISAADGADFLIGGLPAGSVTFDVGETSKVVTIQVAGDIEVEEDETFELTINSVPPNGQVVLPSDEATIENDDAAGGGGTVVLLQTDFNGDTGGFVYRDDLFGGDNGRYADGNWDGQALNVTLGGINNFVVTGMTGGWEASLTLDEAMEVNLSFLYELIMEEQYEADEYAQVLVSIDGGTPIVVDEMAGNGNGGPDETTGLQTFMASLGTLAAGDHSLAIGLYNSKKTWRDESSYLTIDDVTVTGTPQAAAPPDAIDTFFAIAAEDATKEEGDAGTTAYTFTVTRSGDTSAADSVGYSVVGSGIDAGDFAGGVIPSGSLAFAAGETSKTLTIQVAGDSEVETDEGFGVMLDDPSAGTAIATAGAAGYILNDDGGASPPSYLAIAAEDAVKAEGDAGTTAFTFTVTRSGDTSGAGSVDWAVSSSDADAADFGGSLPGGGVNFAAGEVSKTVTVDVSGDSDFEADEDFTVILSNASAGSEITTASAGGTILNDDPAPPSTFFAIAAEDAVKAEGDAGTTAFTFTVTRSGDTSGAGSVDWAVSSSDADAADFGGSLPGGGVNFAAGEVSKTVTVDVSGDTDFEADEDFTVILSNASAGSEITTASAGGTIINDDAAPPATFLAIAAEDAAKAEGDAGSTAFTFTVTRSGDTSGAGSVDWGVSGPDMDSFDFVGGVLPSGTVSFAAGEASKTITVNVAGDTDFEADEDFTVSLSNPSVGSQITTASADGTILNDDPAPPAAFFALAAEDAVKAEGDAGTSAFTFTVARSGDTSGAGSVDWTVSGAAVDGADFGGSLPGGTVSFAAGELSKTITVDVFGDTDFEADEDFAVTLSNPSAGSEITVATAGGIILNDDPAPPSTFFAIAAEDAVKAEGDAGSTGFTFTVTRSGDTSGADSVDWAASGGGVTGADFGGVLPAGTVNFATGEVSKTVTVNVTGDTDFEADEAFTVTLSNASAGATITTASADGTILNDDTPPAGPVTVIDESFDSDSGSFTYADNSFGGSAGANADGSWDSGALRVDLGAGSNTTVTNMSGAWTTSFTLDTESEVSLSFLYELTQSEQYEADEYSQVLVSIDGGAPILVASLTGDGNGGGAQTTGLQTFNAVIGVLAAGDHSLTIGAFNNKKTWSDEFTGLTIDDVTATATPTTPPEPIDTSYAIAATDAVLSEGDAGTTIFTFTVTRSGDLIQDGGVDFTVVGTGANADDFLGGLLPSGSVIFDSPGASAATISIEVVGDTDFEADEDFTVVLSNPAAGGEITVASATGTILNDDPEPSGPVTLVEADFNASGDTGGFVYSDGVFGGSAAQANADGSWFGGALTIDLGAGSNSLVTDMSGAWEIDFSVAADMDVFLTFSYELLISTQYEADEYSQVLVSVDGGAPITVDELFGDGNGGPDQTTGLHAVVVDLGSLAAGDHSLAIGGYNSKKTWSDEFTEITIDDVLVTGTLPAGASETAPVGVVAGGGAEAQPLGLSETELLATTGI